MNRRSERDERVSRGPAEPDGGVDQGASVPLAGAGGIGPGGRGVIADEELRDVAQEPGLDAPYGSRSSSEEQATLRPDTPVGADSGGTVGSGREETPGKVIGTQF
jgi:hypothetical protein